MIPYVSVDDDTADLLALVADTHTPLGADRYAVFLAACRQDARLHNGIVSPNRVRDALSVNGDLPIAPRTYSALWSAACSKNGPMRTTDQWVPNTDKKGRNVGKVLRLRVWKGTP